AQMTRALRFAGLVWWLLAVVTACIGVAALAIEGGGGANDLTFFVLSDLHVGAEDLKATPPVTTAATFERVRARMSATASIVGRPYPERPELAGLRLGAVQPPRGVFILGDLTDGHKDRDRERDQWRDFERIVPRAGLDWNGRTIPVFALAGNHDGFPTGPQREGLVERNRWLERQGALAALSPNGVHFALDWHGVHIVSLNLYPADQTDREHPFKYGQPEASRWNDPESALSFLKAYLSSRVGASGQPVFVMHHYGFDDFSTNDWYWWTSKQRAELYRVLASYNVAAILHGHDHHADHYRWPDAARHSADLEALFGNARPKSYRQYDVLSCGAMAWVVRIADGRLVAVHLAEKDWSAEAGGVLVKRLRVETSQEPLLR
ncbi:MAG: metallophosphoesterase, partial [Bacteroidales bacterium]